jgi:acetolactate synthase-1/3 small subunit
MTVMENKDKKSDKTMHGMAGGQCGDCKTCYRQCNERVEPNCTHEGQTFYTMIIYSENFAGILNQITAVFTRRQVNIESLNVCASSSPGVHKYTLTCWCTEEMAEMLIKQIEKKIDVLKADYFTDSDIFFIESCLIKISTPLTIDNPEVSRIIRKNGASIVEMNSTFSIVERKGKSNTISELYNSLNDLGVVLQFVRSGRIAVTRSYIEHLDIYLEKRERERQ